VKVLYVTGSCLTNNTSANMSHNAFIQGLIENGCDVDILMAKDSWGEADKGLPVWESANYYVFASLSLGERLRRRLHSMAKTESLTGPSQEIDTPAKSPGGVGWKTLARNAGKKAFYTVFKKDPLYPLEKEWLKNASRFHSDKHYDLVISNSSPAASHRLVCELKNKERVRFSRWIQIWEDPWYHDLYGGQPKAVEQEEHSLLRQATEVVYVSPLTLMYQKRYFPDCADKMSCIPLPALRLPEQEKAEEAGSFGYFGDYYSATRNLEPFYQAVRKTGCRCYIYGDSDLRLETTEEIDVSGRVTLEKLSAIQARTDVLVHLSNLHGGQIPGKIYHYSATDKPILFILDGTEEEQAALKEYFGTFDRYCFCKNTVEDICQKMDYLLHNGKNYTAVEAFLPGAVVRKLLE